MAQETYYNPNSRLRYHTKDFVAAMKRTQESDPEYFEHLLHDFIFSDEYVYPKLEPAPKALGEKGRKWTC